MIKKKPDVVENKVGKMETKMFPEMPVETSKLTGNKSMKLSVSANNEKLVARPKVKFENQVRSENPVKSNLMIYLDNLDHSNLSNSGKSGETPGISPGNMLSLETPA